MKSTKNINKKQKRIGLCCCYKQRNYGSQLQSYATTVEMKNRGVNCEVIRYKKKFTPKFMREAKLWTLPFNRIFLSERILRVKKKLVLALHSDVKRQNAARNAKLAAFSRERFTNLSRQCVGPEEFLNLIRGAEYVCTDSFHGSVFSLLYHKKLMIFKRYDDASKTSKNSRIYSLCENLNVKSRLFDGGNLKEILCEPDWNDIDGRIEALRRSSKAFLDKAISLIEESVD